MKGIMKDKLMIDYGGLDYELDCEIVADGEVKVVKTYLSAWNMGATNTNARCYYTGSSVCWGIIIGNVPHIAVTRKRDALAIKEWVDGSDWDRETGDLEMLYASATRNFDVKTV